MWPPGNFLIIATLLLFIVAAGTIGFELIKGWGFMDAAEAGRSGGR